MEHLREICKCLKTLVDFLLCHCDNLSKHDPKPWDPPFDLSQPKLDPPLAVAIIVFLFIVTALSSHYHHGELFSGRKKTREPKEENVTLGPTVWEGEQVFGVAHIFASFNDTFIHVTDLSGRETLVRITGRKKCMEDAGEEEIHEDAGEEEIHEALPEFLISNGKANGGEIITALFAVILSSLGLNQAAINFYSFEQGRIAAYKLFEMISCSNSSLNQDGSTLATMQGNIEFRNIYFSYLSRLEILILSGNVPARKIVALVGRNDSRKSSIIPLMERFYDLTLGEEPTLLSLSIKDNIAYGRSATSDQIEEAAKTIHAHDFITSLEMGYETQVGRTGLTLTEEQKIKISIARVVLSNPSILLLDEVTSGLDFEAEKVAQEALDILMLGRSTIIIARRLSLILLYI
ncbi:hypothetical protein ZIOFF_056355 [Zingiber officinale]|uniref:ABC transporter domain-containing protein n=1 Tax=Zingiber officinale TaxID=94328 RepID=A0A8J5FDU3_ZINOF|nr:hypothetical protein ZIOFF_056355 [Zingiber officinale]